MPKKNTSKRYRVAGDSGVIVSFADESDAALAMLKARKLADHVRSQSQKISEAILDVILGMNNVLIQYDPIHSSSADIIASLEDLLPKLEASKDTNKIRHWQIPVLYGGEVGPDLEDVSEKTGFPPEEVIARHMANPLTIAIMGFMPGLGYMQGVDPALTLPRRSTPRKRVPARTLGIAMGQSVIYPLDSPGGWNLIGKVPIWIFDQRRDDPILFRPGDRVSFKRIDEDEFAALEAKSAKGETIITPTLEKAS